MLGLRGEYTNRSLKKIQEDSIFSFDKFDFFPSAHFSYELNKNNQLMTSYSRRINRPNGRDLDPFPNYINRYTIRIGNPALKPEYTDSYELSYMRKFGTSFLSLETFYRSTKDLMSRKESKQGNVNVMTMANFDNDYSLGAELMGNINFTKWLLVNASFTVYDYRLVGDSVDKGSTNYSGRLNTTIKFNQDSRLQLTGNYRSGSVSVQGEQKAMLFTNISYRQDFMKKKLSATLSLRDVFGTAKFEGSNVGPNFVSNFRFQREPRVLMLTLSYKINNYKMDREGPQEQPSQGGGGDDMF
jgi:outer membrane receptor protein involved in Fe transport